MLRGSFLFIKTNIEPVPGISEETKYSNDHGAAQGGTSLRQPAVVVGKEKRLPWWSSIPIIKHNEAEQWKPSEITLLSFLKKQSFKGKTRQEKKNKWPNLFRLARALRIHAASLWIIHRLSLSLLSGRNKMREQPKNGSNKRRPWGQQSKLLGVVSRSVGLEFMDRY